MNIEKMREEFKAWESDADDGPQTDPMWLMFDSTLNQFALIDVQQRWKAWQASRAAIEVELPKEGSMLGDGHFFEVGVEACKEAIESLGLKIKVKS